MEINLTEEEQNELQSIHNETQGIIYELGEIELIKIQLEKRYEEQKQRLLALIDKESKFNAVLNEKYSQPSIEIEPTDITS